MIEDDIKELLAARPGSWLIFSGDGQSCGEELEGLLALKEDLYLAAPGGGGTDSRLTCPPRERVLDRSGVDFVDRVKAVTSCSGFENVVVLGDSPADVRAALGVAGVFGSIFLARPPRDGVSVDLHNTLLYKSLTVKPFRSGAGKEPPGPSGAGTL